MLLSRYQKTEIITGTLLFPIIYYYYLKLTSKSIMVSDILWCTLTLFLILLFKNFYMNFNLLQSQAQNFHLML
jgi:hypothetical protein